MKIINSLRAGLVRSGQTWKGILISWLVSMLLVSMVAIPMKSAFVTGLGNSTISEKLKDGINIEVFADLRANFSSLASYFSMGMIMILMVGFVVNSFLSGGLFNSLRLSSGKFSSQEFFRSAAQKFWPVFIISLIMSMLIIFLAVIIIVIPVTFISLAETSTEVAVFNSALLLGSLFLFVLIVMLIVADYARAWLVSHDENSCFMAIGYGFRETFRTFYSSYPLMLIVIIIQVLFMWLVLSILQGIKPQSGLGIAILFLTSQFLFIIKLFLKTIRYGSITALMESGITPMKSQDLPNIVVQEGRS